MHEVKVYDDSGNLKKIISVKALQKRSDRLIETPSLVRKSGRNSNSSAKDVEHNAGRSK